MKKNKRYVVKIFLLASSFFSILNADTPITGISATVYQAYHQVFHSGGCLVQGFVSLDNGFTVLPGAYAVFDTFVPVNGPIDLRETGILTLIDDLNLGSNVTFSSGGIINGRGCTIFLGDSLTIPSNKIIHIGNNTTIDGRGNALIIGDYAQLMVDTSVTLTLQNMVLKSGSKTGVFPPVRCAGSASKLVLDNVVIEPQADIPFFQGQLYIHDDVIFSGTSAFVYTSPQSSFITSGATLLFDKSTTFSFAPSTQTNNQIKMVDATSKIVLDSCTLKCTDTGFRLTTGRLLCDNKVNLDSWSGSYLSSLTTVTSGIYYKTSGVLEMRCGWSPDGRFFSVTGDIGSAVRVYRVYGAGGLLGTTVATLPLGTIYILTHAWSPDMRSILIGGAGGSYAGWWAQYSFNGITFSPTVVNSRYTADGTSRYPTAIEWSPDGNYFVFGTYNGGGFYVYKVNTFSGSGYTSVANGSWSGNIWSIKWHPSGNYLAVCGDAGLYIYRFNGASVTSVASKLVGSTMVDVNWSPDGQYVALGVLNANTVDGNILANDDLRIYSFNSVTGALTPVVGRKYGTGSGAGVYGLSWHPDGKTLAVGGYGAANGGTNNPFNDTNLVRIYQFTGSSLNGLISYTLPSPLSNITYMWDCKWDPTGNYLCIAGYDASYYEYYGILQASFVPQPNPQTLFSQSTIFGGGANSFIFPSSSLLVSNALYGNPPTTDVTSFVNYNLFPKQGGSFAITARDEVITGTMSSFTYTATNFSPSDQRHTVFWNRGWPLTGGAADTYWTKLHAVATRDLGIVLANVGQINTNPIVATSYIITSSQSYLIDIGGPTNTASFIAKGDREFGYTSTRYHANPTQILDGDNALIAPNGGDYWASFNRTAKEISWGKGTIVGLDPKQTWTDAARFSGINRVGFCSSADAVFSNISIGAGMDASAYTYTCYSEQSYFPKGGWALPGGTNDLKWIKYYFGGIGGDADVTFMPRANISPLTGRSTGIGYLINIRGYSNTKSAICRGVNNNSYIRRTTFSTAGSAPGYFWASIQQSNDSTSVTLQWGTGSVVGLNMAQTYTDTDASRVLSIDRVAPISYNASTGGGAQPFSNIQVGYGADPGTELVLNYQNNLVATLGQNQTLALAAPATQAFSNSLVFGNSALGSASNLNVKMLSGARVEIRGQVVDDPV